MLRCNLLDGVLHSSMISTELLFFWTLESVHVATIVAKYDRAFKDAASIPAVKSRLAGLCRANPLVTKKGFWGALHAVANLDSSPDVRMAFRGLLDCLEFSWWEVTEISWEVMDFLAEPSSDSHLLDWLLGEKPEPSLFEEMTR